MATIQTRKTKYGELRYRVQVRLEGHPVLSRTFERRTDAKKWGRDTEAAIAAGRHDNEAEVRPRRTLADLVERYVSDVLPGKPAVANLYGRHLRWWKECLGAYYLSDLTADLIEGCYTRLLREPGPTGRERSASTANRYLISLSACLGYARKRLKWIDRNPVADVDRHREPKGRVRFLSRPVDEENCELDRLLAACRKSRNHDLYDLVVLGLWTGCRESELLCLRRSHVRLSERGLVLPAEVTKDNEDRFVPLVGPALEVIERRMKQGMSDYLMAGRRDAKKDGPPAFPRRAWNTALGEAGIENFRFHDLRHTHASYLAMSGATERELMEALGHATTVMAARYSHLSDTHKHHVAERLRSAWGGWGGELT